MLKYLKKKDIKNRKNYNFFEIKKLIYNSISKDLRLSVNIRERFLLKLLNNKIKKISITKINNRCILTNKSKNIYKKFKLSRICFLNSMENKKIIGFIKR